jgi:hypothetical protein
MTLSIMKLNGITFSKATFSLGTFSIVTLRIIEKNNKQIMVTRHSA